MLKGRMLASRERKKKGEAAKDFRDFCASPFHWDNTWVEWGKRKKKEKEIQLGYYTTA
jgi:hypothetical protein